METKQTAVEWLVEQLASIRVQNSGYKNIEIEFNDFIGQAKKMEKEQMQDSYCFGILDAGANGIGFNHYYQETFKSR